MITFPNELRESTGFAQSANARLSPPRLSAFSRAREAKADATASVKRLNNEYRYHLLTKAASRKPLNELRSAQGFAREQKWSATALVIDVDPFTLL